MNEVTERCSWCGGPVPAGDGYRAAEPAGERVATFCGLPHVAPWAAHGAHWEAGVLGDEHAPDRLPGACSHCGEPLSDAYVVLVERWGEARIADVFCSADHLAAWAKAGGRGR